MKILAYAFPFCFVLAERQTKKFIKKELNNQNENGNKTMRKIRQYRGVRGKLPTFSQSVSQRRKVGGKSYFVRRYFRAGQDFGKTMERLAVKQSYMKDAG